jgi:serine/threonine-protein kinase
MMHDPAQLNAALTGRYEIEREVGQGGMATVFLAKDLKHNRHVALKVLSTELAAVVGRERFLSEIEVTANLHHPHLLPLFDSGDAGGLLFYVMPYVEGESLRKRLERERQVSIDEAVHIASAVGSALDYAHRHGVIHRDLKPENILMHEREPLVMDFGIALAVSNAGGARVTQAGISLGTPQYMSPEQATGDRPIDARSDIYSLGALTYELIAGQPPHTGSSIQSIMARVITDKPESLRAQRDTVPEHVEDAVMRALAKLPADRYATAADFVSALTSHRSVAMSATQSQVLYASEVRQLPIAAPAPRPVVTRRGLALLGVTVLLAAAGGAFGVRAMRKTDPGAQYRFVLDLSDSMPTNNTRYRQIALSRDASRAVFHFAALWPGPLYTRRMGEMHFDIIPGSDSAHSPLISPDGKFVLYWIGDATNASGSQARLMKLPIEGGAPVQIADSAWPHTQATWGDQHQVIFRRDNHLVLVSDDGGAERASYWPDTTNHQFALGWPELLPGGKAAVVTVNRARSSPSDSQYLGVLNLADGKVTDLDVRGFTPHFAQGHVLYLRMDGQLYARPFDVKKLRFTGEARAIAKDLSLRGIGSDQERGVSDLAVSDAGMILFTDGGPTLTGGGGGGGRWSIVRRKNAGQSGDFLQVPQLPYRDMRASPDGSMLALTIADTTSNSRTDIFLLTFATGNLRRLTHDGKSSGPVWMPDGKRVVFRVTDPGGKPIRRFYSQPWNESEPPKPLEGADGAEAEEFPGPQGKYIAYVRGDSGLTDNIRTNSDIYIAPIDSPAAQRPFAATGLREHMARFSPDGKWLAYIGHELPSGGAAQVGFGILYAREVPGPGPVIPVSIQYGQEPLWAPDGRSLYYFAGILGAPFTAARLAKGSEFKITTTQEVFGRNNPGTNFGFPSNPWQTDMLPNGDVLYFSSATPPPVVSQTVTGRPGAAGVVAAAPDVEFRVIAMVNWLGAERPAGQKR